MKEQPTIVYLPPADLHFDYANPRLAEFGIERSTPESSILETLWEAMDVMELVQSISASGFFPHESLIVAEEDSRKVVIEGNRRLAAVKVLLSPELARKNGWEVPPASKPVLETLQALPCIVASRSDSWQYLGFKHVNGPAKWTSYAKAAYIAHVHREFKVPLSEIAGQIGDRHRTVQRLYRGLMALEQAEREKVYDREDRFRQRLAFSHLYTGLDYEGFQSFLDLAPMEKETDSPVPEGKIKELGEVLTWLYGSRKEKKEPLVTSQNPHLRQLNAALGVPEAVAALRANVSLERAFEASQPPESLFQNALLAAKRELTTARAYLTSGDDGSESTLRSAGTVAQIAADIYDEMERKRTRQTKKFKTES